MIPISAWLKPARKRSRLFRKYASVFAALVKLVMLANGAVEFWFLYRDHTELLARLQQDQAGAAADKIGQFIREIEGPLGWTTQLPWAKDTSDQHRVEALRLLRQVPAVTELTQVDATGLERLRVSRVAMNVYESRLDHSQEVGFIQAVEKRTYRGPVYFRRDSEPYMTIAMAGARRDAGVSIAEVNLKFVWDVVSQIRVGDGGKVYIVDSQGRLIAHPDISLVLSNTNFSSLPQVRAALASAPWVAPTLEGSDLHGKPVLAASAAISPQGWLVIAELPLDEAHAPLYDSMRRAGIVLLLGITAATLVAMLLARQMTVPIRALKAGAARIGGGDLSAKVTVNTNDELEELADQFNSMSRELLSSKEREERVGRLRRFLSPQITNVIESSGSETLLESHRREVSVVFCDMRGFTAFAENATPAQVMTVLSEYHAALGSLIFKFEGTLERFVGDGVLVLFNDPIPCPDPCQRAVRMAIEMQAGVAELAKKWRVEGHDLGFGIGITYGTATLGRIGFEGRFDYSAIGSVVNLAARICGEARDGQTLIDFNVHAVVAPIVECEAPMSIPLKGIRHPVTVFNVLRMTGEDKG